MLKDFSEYDWIVTLLTAIVILVLLVAFIIPFVLIYQKRRTEQVRAMNDLTLNFQQELLQTQLEIQEQTLQKIS